MGSIERLGSDHIHLVQKIRHEDIAISECCRGQKPNQYIEYKHEAMLILKTNKMRRLCKCNAMRKTLLREEFGDGVTDLIGSIRPRHGAQLSWRSEVKFHVNVFTLRM